MSEGAKDADVDRLTREDIIPYVENAKARIRLNMREDVESVERRNAAIHDLRVHELALSSLSQEAVRDEAWLIERGEAPWIEYWGGEHIRLWTKDVYKAVWFPTELAAKTVGWEMRVHPGTGSETRVIQHGFAALKREPNAAARQSDLAQTEIKGHMRIAKEATGEMLRIADLNARNVGELKQAQARITDLEKDAARLDHRRLHDAFTDIVARALHYFDNFEKISKLETATEVTAALEGGIDKYLKDSIYHAKVDSLIAQLMNAIDAALKSRA